jgi:hypothetical protein
MPRPQRNERKVGGEIDPNINSVSENQTAKENPRPKRPKVDGGFRNRLTVADKDPAYVYRWFLDTDSSGARIHWKKKEGWELAPNLGGAGERDAKSSTNDSSSIVRVPANKSGEYLYLMRIYKEWYDEIQAEKQDEVNSMDRQIHTQRDLPGSDGRMERLYNDPGNETSMRLDDKPGG